MPTTNSQTFVLKVPIFETLETTTTACVTDEILSFSETKLEIINQPNEDSMSIADEIPQIHSVGDAVLFWEDFWGFVKGEQKTIYITDERYIIRHDL